MAKISAGHTAIHGKLGNLVYVQNGRYAPHVRKEAEPGSRKHEPAFAQQHSRTAYLNRLAGAVNSVMKQLAGPLKSRQLYEDIQKLFRKEPDNNRLLLLRRLQGMEANPRYAFRRHADPVIHITVTGDTFRVSLAARKHPAYDKKADANCYAYEMAFTTWAEEELPPHTALQAGGWLPLNGPGALFEFDFAIPAGARHWMLCIKLCSGLNNTPTRLFTTDGALIYTIGSFDAAEQAWLQALPPVNAVITPAAEEEPAPMPRIAARPLPEDV